MCKKDESARVSALVLLGSIAWLAIRSGTKPTRIVYPCQQAAVSNMFLAFSFLPSYFSFTFLALKRKTRKWTKTIFIAIILVNLTVVAKPILESTVLVRAQTPNQELTLTLAPHKATLPDPSNIYVVNGRSNSHINSLITLMDANGLNFYTLIQPDDVVIIKINEEWPERGGTNTDVLKELLQAIINHPQGWNGEIVVADNGQFQGSMDWPDSNAEDPSQSTQDIVNMFASSHRVSTYSWMPIRSTQVNEYSDGDINDGYVLYSSADSLTGIVVSYPKFQTQYDTCISFKYGVWNGAAYEPRLKIINLPVLKSHSYYGVTGATKHYMGVQSEGGRGQAGLANGHETVATGGMGTLLAETRMPTLNIIDAIYVNAIPPGNTGAGPNTPYEMATRVNVLAASTDPVALDYWASKNVLMQTSQTIGYVDTHTLDPDSTNRQGVSTEALGIWLPLTQGALVSRGFQTTINPEQINIYVLQQSAQPPPGPEPSTNGEDETKNWMIIQAALVAATILIVVVVCSQRGRLKFRAHKTKVETKA